MAEAEGQYIDQQAAALSADQFLQNGEVLAAARILLEHVSNALTRGEEEGQISKMMAGLKATLDTLPQPFRIHNSLIEEPNPIARRVRIQQRLKEVRGQMQDLGKPGIIKLDLEAEILSEDAKLNEIEAWYVKKMQALEQKINRMKLYQQYRPDEYDGLERDALEEELAVLGNEKEARLSKRRTELELQMMKSVEDQIQNEAAHEGADKQQESQKEAELERWLHTLTQAARSSLVEAFEDRKSSAGEPYRLKDEPFLVLRQANEVIRYIKRNAQHFSKNETRDIKKTLFHLLSQEDEREFLLTAIEAAKQCSSAQKKRHLSGEKQKWRERLLGDIENLIQVLPREDQIRGCGISGEWIEKAKMSIGDLLKSFGVKEKAIVQRLKEMEKAKKESAQENDEDEPELVELLALIKETPKEGVYKKSSARRAKERENEKRVERSRKSKKYHREHRQK